MYRKVFEITGYAYEGDSYCTSCLSEKQKSESYPIFLGDETDYQMCCGSCFEEIDTNVLNFCEKHQSYECDCFDRS